MLFFQKKIISNKKDKEKSTTKGFANKKDKEFSKPTISEDIIIDSSSELNTQNKSLKIKTENETLGLIDKNNETELSDEINNARKKRRRSSASIE